LNVTWRRRGLEGVPDGAIKAKAHLQVCRTEELSTQRIGQNHSGLIGRMHAGRYISMAGTYPAAPNGGDVHGHVGRVLLLPRGRWPDRQAFRPVAVAWDVEHALQ